MRKLNTMISAAVLVLAIASAASAETWYLAADSAANSADVNNLAKWTNSVGTVGTGAPSITDEMVVIKARNLRIGGPITTLPKSVTINGKLTHDGTGEVNWANDGIFFAPGSSFTLNTYHKAHSFLDSITAPINGKVTILSDGSSSPVYFPFSNPDYSNTIYRLERLIGGVGTSVQVYNGSTKAPCVNNTLQVDDASQFKGSLTGKYRSDDQANAASPLANGEFGGRVILSGLDTPGALNINKNWVLGATPGGVTRAATVKLAAGARVEAAISEAGLSRLEATTSLTLEGVVEIFLTGSGEFAKVGRYPVLSAPTPFTLDDFTLRVSPLYGAIDAELELEASEGTYTLFVNLHSYGSFFVDAVNGNDAFDGSTFAIPDAAAIAAGGVIAGPKRSLVAVMALTTPGSTVYAAEGVYDEGEIASGKATANRVTVPPMVTLVAAARREHTIIKGRLATGEADANGCGEGALRCVGLKNGAVVKGFTLIGGRTAPGSNDGGDCNGGAVWGMERGLIADCVISNCASAYRGGCFLGDVTLLRCHTYPALNRQYDYYGGVRVIDSVIHDSAAAYRNCHFVNCTFTQGSSITGNSTHELAYIRNCLHYYPSSSSMLGRSTRTFNSYFRSQFPPETIENVQVDELSRFGVSAEELPYSTLAYRPLKNSVAIGKGDLEMYLATTNSWPVTMRREFTMKDIYGTDRLAGGALDLGAVQHRPEPECRYVDAVNGSDANDGFTPAGAKRTLKGVFESWLEDGDYEEGIVYAAPGVYDEGEMFYANCSNRVVVMQGMGLIATHGAGATTIRGKFGELENDSKAGPSAVRCVYLLPGAYIQGFTITGGATQQASGKEWGLHGGGVYSENGAVVACEIYGNAGGGSDAAYRGPGGFGGTYIGCYVHDNIGNYQIFHSTDPKAVTVINSVLLGVQALYSSGGVLNSTFDNRANAISWDYGGATVWNSYLGVSGRGVVYTNCCFSSATFEVINNSDGLPTNGYDPETCRFGVKETFVGSTLPPAGSPLVDAASIALYDEHFPAKWAQFKNVGLLGQQRIYNGAIDIGGGEYDVRGDLGFKLNPARKVAVKEASDFVTLSPTGVELAGGAEILLEFTFPAAGVAALSVAGEVKVVADGIELLPQDGVYMLYGPRASVHSVKVINMGDLPATLTTCRLPERGMAIYLR